MIHYLKKVVQIACIIVLTHCNCNAQSSQISFFHLGDYIQQSTDVSPVYIPKNNSSYGLPGIGINIANGFSYADLLTNIPGTNKVKYNYQNVLNKISREKFSNLNQSITINVLNFAFKRKKGSISFFANIRENIKWKMSKNGIINTLANGITDKVIFNDKINSSAYIETGIGFTQQFLNKKLAIGIRTKLLIGIANVSTPKGASAKIIVDEDLMWTVNTNNAVLRTTGKPDEGNNYKMSTANKGFGIDIGATYDLIPELVFEVAVNDIGFINWKKNTNEYYLNNVKDLKIKGTNIDGSNPVLQNLNIQLKQEVGSGERKENSYTTNLFTTSYLSATYKITSMHHLKATLFRNDNTTLALGYNILFPKTTFGIVGIKNEQNTLDFGVNLATQLGPIQFYAATDNLNRIVGSLENVKLVNVRFGINIVFGDDK